MSKVKIIKEIRLPQETPTNAKLTPSSLTVLDSKIIPIIIPNVWVYGPKTAVDFKTLKRGLERMLKDPRYAASLCSKYCRRPDGTWFREKTAVKEAVILVKAEAPNVKVRDNQLLGWKDLPEGLLSLRDTIYPDRYNGRLDPAPILYVQHTALGVNGACAVAIALHHTFADQHTFTRLVRDLGKFCRRETVENPIELGCVGEFKVGLKNPPEMAKPPQPMIGFYPSKVPKWLDRGFSWLVRRPGSGMNFLLYLMVVRNRRMLQVNFSAESVAELKAELDNPILSTNDILTAILTCAKVRSIRNDEKIPDKTNVFYAFSLRGKDLTEPMIGETVFCNGVTTGHIELNTDLILKEEPFVALSNVALAMRTSVRAMNRKETIDQFLSYMQAAPQKDTYPLGGVLGWPTTVTVSNWSFFHESNPAFSPTDNGSPDSIRYDGFVPGDRRNIEILGVMKISKATQGRNGFDVSLSIKEDEYDNMIENMKLFKGDIIPDSFIRC